MNRNDTYGANQMSCQKSHRWVVLEEFTKNFKFFIKYICIDCRITSKVEVDKNGKNKKLGKKDTGP